MEGAMQKLDRYQVRSQKTLASILKAAEDVFVRDGFESAQMDEIATRAERSKGAVYVHFKSKEDLFLALMEHRIENYVQRHSDLIDNNTTQSKRLAAFRDFIERLADDRAYHVLSLEFKLFALRRPEWKERYEKAIHSLYSLSRANNFEQMFGQRPKGEKAELEASMLALGPIANSLVLESYFEPTVLSDKAIRRILNRIFAALIPTS